MWDEIKAAYAGSLGVARAIPLLFLLPFAAEALQHIVEYRIGLFASPTAMHSLADHPARMATGQVKIFTLLVINFWVTRQLARQEGASLAVIGDRRALLLFLWVMLWGLATAMLQQFAPLWLATLLPNTDAVMIFAALLGTVVMLVDIYLNVWKVGAALGNPTLGIAASFRLMHGRFWWSLAFFVLMFLPLMAVHYALNYAAAGRPEPVTIAILTIDALVVGYLGIVLLATNYRIARRAASRSGIALAEA